MDVAKHVSAQYRHSPLQNPAQQIRLLRYHRRPDEIVTEFEMQVWHIDDCPAYYALSYCWGDASQTMSVTVNKRTLRVGINAHYALLQAISLQKDEVSHYWMDAICIHQSDAYEKGHQVRIMGRIYSEASRVFNCVGPESDFSDLLFTVMDRYFPHHPYDVRDRYTRRKTQLEEYANTLSLDSECIDQLCVAMESFVRRPYLERLWVLQEIMIAPEPGLVLCGLSAPAVTFWQILDINGALASLKLLTTDYMSPLRRVGHDIEHRVVVHGQPPAPLIKWSLPNLVALCQGFKCRDPRDHIYGILSLLQLSADMPPIEVNYKLTAKQVFLRILPYYLAEHGELVHQSLSILSKALSIELSQEQYLMLKGCHCLDCARRSLQSTSARFNCKAYAIFDTNAPDHEMPVPVDSDHDCMCLQQCPSPWSPEKGILKDESRVLLLRHGYLGIPPTWSVDLTLPDDADRKCYCQV